MIPRIEDITCYPILLVEDNPDDVLFIRRAFSQAQIINPLQVVGGGEEATNYFLGHGIVANRQEYPLPVLVLLDLKLPRKSGYEVLDWVRRQPLLKRIPVVILTSSRNNEDINRCYDLGANSYLVKPVQFEALLDMMKTLHLYWIFMNEKPDL